MTKTSSNLPHSEHLSIVLVNTSHPGNIGATARAMKNMGLSRLVLVQPVEFPSGVAVSRAASALDILERAEIHHSLEAAVANCTLVIGASARSRKIPWPMLSPQQCAEQALAESPKGEVALVFGREDSGLTNEELQLCHYHVQIPTSQEYPSLNLAAAVLILCYELRLRALTADSTVHSDDEDFWDIERATGRQVEQFYEHLEQVLTRLDFLDPENPRQLMLRLRRLFSRVRLDTMELNILRGVLTHVEYHLDNPQPGSGKTARRQAQKARAGGDQTNQGSGRKDFEQARLRKRSLSTMAEILEKASKPDGSRG